MPWIVTHHCSYIFGWELFLTWPAQKAEDRNAWFHQRRDRGSRLQARVRERFGNQLVTRGLSLRVTFFFEGTRPFKKEGRSVSEKPL
jgi:hypothetical protein